MGAGPDLAATRWLVEEQGAVMVGSDTSGYEVNPPAGPSGSCWVGAVRAGLLTSACCAR